MCFQNLKMDQVKFNTDKFYRHGRQKNIDNRQELIQFNIIELNL